ncbi:MAG: FAD-dependent oxidoreductase [Alphaproteobacteria bacterium]|nr:FAD-dependent oxidoreductase [Alphaproteobacteria bacterium]
MTDRIEADLCVIGAGSGGLSVAAGAQQMGAKVVLFEAGEMGGDCLNYGCVPSKSLLVAGRTAHTMRTADRFGIAAATPAVDAIKVRDHVKGVIGAIAPHDSQERFEGFGVHVIRKFAKFAGPDTVVADGVEVKAKRFVVATGSSAFVPPIPGLADVPYLINETVFELTETPSHLVVIGGGPIGVELAQAHRRLGAEVTIVEALSLLPKDDPEAAEIVRRHLVADGIALREGAKVVAVRGQAGAIEVDVEKDGSTETLAATHLLVAAGRKPNVDGLDLEKAGIAYSPKGIEVDDRLRTRNPKVYAIGDSIGGYQFTHVAGYHASVIIKNVLFRLPSKVDYSALPWVTFTDPELAQVGHTEASARQAGLDFEILRWSFAENDRAQAERETDGFVKVIITRKGRVLGATIVGPHAGELIQTWALAISQKIKVGAIASMIAPYPTLGEVNKRAAGSWYTPKLFNERTRKIVRFLLKFS